VRKSFPLHGNGALSGLLLLHVLPRLLLWDGGSHTVKHSLDPKPL